MSNVEHPKYYQGTNTIECIEAMEMTFGKDAIKHFALCNIYKYVWRYDRKDKSIPKEDLEKARFYIHVASNMYLTQQEKNTVGILSSIIGRLSSTGGNQ